MVVANKDRLLCWLTVKVSIRFSVPSMPYLNPGRWKTLNGQIPVMGPEPGTLSGWAQRIDDELELGLVRDEANPVGDFRLRNSLAMPITRLYELSRTVRHSEPDNPV